MNTFKQFIQKIIDAKDQTDAVKNVFYGEKGVDMAYQKGKITYKEHEMLLALINKIT